MGTSPEGSPRRPRTARPPAPVAVPAGQLLVASTCWLAVVAADVMVPSAVVAGASWGLAAAFGVEAAIPDALSAWAGRVLARGSASCFLLQWQADDTDGGSDTGRPSSQLHWLAPKVRLATSVLVAVAAVAVAN